jgi:hypothetical protein
MKTVPMKLPVTLIFKEMPVTDGMLQDKLLCLATFIESNK